MIPAKVLFIGLGGAGQRHLRILRRLLPEGTAFTACRRTQATPLLRPDFTVAAAGSVEDEYGLTVFDSLEAAFADSPDLAVISTPTACHREPMMMALAANCSVLVEKPWAESLTDFAAFRDGMVAKNLAFQISFQRRFHPFMAQARAALAAGSIGRPLAASFTVYSNVPAWHPYENWRNLYAVRSDLGGGVLLTEIHEIDLAHWFFGLPQAVFCTGGNLGPEKLDVEDTVHLILIYGDFSVQLILCFMHERPARHFHIAGTAGDISWDADGNRLTVNRDAVTDASFPNDAMFEAQAQRFLNGWSAADSRIALDAAGGSLAVVAAARASMASGRAEPVQRP